MASDTSNQATPATQPGAADSEHSVIGQLVGIVVFLALGLGAIVAYLHGFPPREYEIVPPPFLGYDSAAMRTRMAPESVQARLETILDFGSRSIGQPGFYATESYIRDAYQAAGLEIYEQHIETVAPQTERAEVRDAAGERLPITVYPFLPNLYQPMTSGAEGVTGKLVLLDEDVINTSNDFENSIAVLDMMAPPIRGFGTNWTKYAELGFKAVIVTHSAGIEEITFRSLSAMTANLPANYVRLAAEPEILRHLGEQITLDVITRYREVPNTTLIGRLASGKGADRALVIPIAYDAASILPDQAAGSFQALEVALQLQLMDALATYKDSLQRDVIFVATGTRMMADDGSNRLLAAIGPYGNPGPRRLEIVEEQAENTIRQERAQSLLALFDDPAFGIEVAASEKAVNALEPAARKFFDTQLQYYLNTRVFEQSEELLRADIIFENDAKGDIQSPEYKTFLAIKRHYDQAFLCAGYPLVKLLRDRADMAKSFNLRDGMRGRLQELVDFHTHRSTRFHEDLALNDLFQTYKDVIVFSPQLGTRQETAAYLLTVQKLHVKAAATTPPEAVRAEVTLDSANPRRLKIQVTGFGAGLDGEHHITDPFLLQHNPLVRRWRKQGGGGAVVALTKVPIASSRPENLSFMMSNNWRDHTGTQPTAMKVHLEGVIQQLGLLNKVKVDFFGKDQPRKVGERVGSIPLQSTMWSTFCYPAFSMVSPGAGYTHYFAPFEVGFERNLTPITNSMQVLGETVLTTAFGNGNFESLTFKEHGLLSLQGSVYVAGVGQSIIPNYPLRDALVCGEVSSVRNGAGYYPYLPIMTDVYGAFRYPMSRNIVTNIYGGVTLTAAAYDEYGRINYFKDIGKSAQAVYKSTGLGPEAARQSINIVAFRAAPVTILDLVNPQTLKAFSGAELIRDVGLASFGSTNQYRDGEFGYTVFVPPAERFFVKLKAGSDDNPNAQQTRAFMLGTPLKSLVATGEDPNIRAGSEITGDGYLADRTPFLLNVPLETAKSMIYVNGQRLAVQNQGDFRMADERTVEFQDKAKELLLEASKEDQSSKQAILDSRDAVTYAILNHPILRKNIWEAVAGIIWYLGLLVPFVFFFEKLVFGYTDIRKQLAAHAVIFLIVFAMLRLLHPAFEMIRSSLMILLGFCIMLISGGITVLFSSKFKENLEEIRKKQGRVSSAEVNTMGVIGTAFLLGLNNMHRRRVRTGLTCATLTLLTFVMICFTSIQSNLVDSRVAIGKAPYPGFLVKEEMFRPVSGSAKSALYTKYGDTFHVVARSFFVGDLDEETRETHNPSIPVVYVNPAGEEQVFEFQTVVHLDPKEPLREKITWATPGVEWFPENPAPTDPKRVMMPVAAARKLGITPEMVTTGDVTVKIAGTEYHIKGLFDGNAFSHLKDLDNHSLLPPDVESLREVTLNANDKRTVLAEETDARISGENALIMPAGQSVTITQHGYERIYSIAVVLPEGLPYKESKAAIDTYLEQSGKVTFFGLDGYSFRGQRARQASFSGLIDMLIPLIIAALTVLNTMKGSVYERRDEIFVYNAVGIAPIYITFMFFAEAFVYATVGSVLGYVLSQGTGRVLTSLDMTGGLNMTFTSASTIYASLTIAASVFISTWFPANSAKKIASTSDDAGWKLPEPEGDVLSFRLPFTFTFKDRIAVLAFFERYFLDHGEGSSGQFFSGKPTFHVVAEPDELKPETPIPELQVPVWLKPFDLGVSQLIAIRMVTDEETGEFISEIIITRRSGTLENWKRLNVVFIRLVRKHFLHWRAVKPEERAAMFDDACVMMTERFGGSPAGATPTSTTSPTTH